MPYRIRSRWEDRILFIRLELIASEQEKPKDRKLFEEIKEQVVLGHALSEALRASRKFTRTGSTKLN